MSKDIENKVVSMEFDNSKFEKPAEQTMSTLDKLKKALNFKGVTNGFEAMQRGIKSVTFSPIEKGIDSVYAKFTFMERFTIQLYDRLANKIISTGHMIASETFTRPISTGKAEYEEKMGAVQTIMASSKKSLEEVNGVLAELNKYADDTIYSFKDMTTSIGKFTNAGVDLKDAVAAIKGISNEAAISGANANEASRAMYNFAQALSSGAVKLIDWKSIENANMATKEFKQQLIDTAVATGTLTKRTDGYYQTTKGKTFTATAKFNDALADQWMTSKVLIKTLGNYADETTEIGKRASAAAKEVKTFSMLIDTLKEALQSGWSESWEHIIGDFNQAKELWTSVSKVIGGLIDRMSEARNTMLKFWSQFGGRTALLQGISNAWKALTTVLGAVRDAFRTLFPPMTGQRLINLTKRFESFTKKLIPSIDTTIKLRDTFKGFFAIIGIGIDAVKALYNVLMPLVGKAFKFLFGETLKSTSSLGKWLVHLREVIKEGRVFETVFGKIGSVLTIVGKALKSLYTYIRDVAVAFRDGGFKAGFEAIKNGFVDMLSYIWKTIKKYNPITALKNLGKKLANIISQWPIGEAIVSVITKIKNVIANSPVWKFCVNVVNGFVETIQKIINKFRHVDTSATNEFTDNVKKGFGPLEAIKNFFSAIWKGIMAVWSVIGPAIKAIGKQIGTAFQNLFNGIKGVVDRSDLGDAGVFGAGTGLGLLMTSLAKFAWDLGKTVKGVSNAVSGFRRLLDSLVGLLKGLKFEAYARSLKDIGIAIALLAGSMWLLAALPADAITRATAAIMFLFRGLSATMNSFSAIKTITDGKAGAAVGILSIGAQLMMMATAITILVADLAILALLPYGALVKGFAMLILMLRAISSEVIKMTTEGGQGKVSLAMISLGVMIQLITVPLLALAGLAALNFKAMAMAVAGIIAIIAVMSECYIEITKASEKNTAKIGFGPAASILTMGAAIIAIGIAIAGLAVASAIITKMFKAENALKDASKIIFGVIWRLGVIAVAMALVSGICSKFNKFAGDANQTSTDLSIGSKVSFNRSGRTGVAGMFFPVIATLVGIGTAMLAVSAAVAIIALSTKGLDDGRFNAVIKAINTIVLLLGVFVIMVAAISKASSKIGDLGNASLKVSVFPSMAAYIFAASAFVIAVAAAAKIIHSVDEKDLYHTLGIIAGVLIAIAALSAISAKFPKFAKGFTIVAKAFILFGKAAMFLGIGVGVIVASLALLSKMTGGEIDKMADNLDKLVEAIQKRKDSIVNAVATLIQTVIESIVVGAGRAVTTMLKEVVKILNEVFDQIILEGPQLFNKLWTVVCMVLDSIVNNAPEVTEKLVKAIIAVIKGLAEAIDRHSSEIVEAINNLLESVLKVIIGVFGRIFGVTKDEIENFTKNIMPHAKRISAILIGMWAVGKVKSAANAILSIISAVVNKLPHLADYYKMQAVGINDAGKTIWANIRFDGLITKIKKSGASVGSALKTVLTKLVSIITSHPLLTVIAGVALSLREWYKAQTEGMRVVQEDDLKTTEIAKKLQQREEEYQELIKKRKDIFEETNAKFSAYEAAANELDNIIGPDGTLKQGYDAQFNALAKVLSGVITLEVGEDGRVKIINDENEALDYQKDALDKILEKQRLQMQLESYQAEYTDALKKRNSGELEKQATEARNARDAYYNESSMDYDFGSTLAGKGLAEYFKNKNLTKGQIVAWYDQIKEELDAAGDDFEKVNKVLNKFDIDPRVLTVLSDMAETFRGAYTYLDRDVQSATMAIAKNNTFIEAYNDTLLAVAQNAPEAGEMVSNLANDILSANEAMSFGNLGKASLYQQYRDAKKEYDDMMALWDEWQQPIPDTEKQYYESRLKYAIDQLKEAGLDLPETAAETGKTAGRNLAKGVPEGMSEVDLKKFINTWADDEIVGPFFKMLKIQSPSKVFAEAGKFCALGVIAGLDNEKSDVEGAFEAMAAASIAAYSATLASESTFAWAPLIDTTGIQNGTAAIQGQLTSLQNNPLTASMTSKLAASVDTSSLELDNTRILNSMTYIQEEISALKDTMANLQVVMDSGLLVGALAPGMDMELGRRTVRKERGV